MDEHDVEQTVMRLIEMHEQKVLELVTRASDEKHHLQCYKCGEVVEAPIYRHQMLCKKCEMPVTLESSHLETLLQAERDILFQKLSELDETFNAQDIVQTRDKMYTVLSDISMFIEASIEASKMLDPQEGFETTKFDSMLHDLVLVRMIEQTASLLGLSPETVQMILDKQITSTFGPKPPKVLAINPKQTT